MSERGVIVVLGLGAAALVGVAAWLVLESRAPPASPSTTIAVPGSAPAAAPIASPSSGTAAPVAPPVIERPQVGLAPIEARFDEARLAQLPEKLPGELMTKARIDLDTAVAEVRKRLEANRPLAEVMEPIDEGRRRLQDFMTEPGTPSVSVHVLAETYDRLEQQVRARARVE